MILFVKKSGVGKKFEILIFLLSISKDKPHKLMDLNTD